MTNIVAAIIGVLASGATALVATLAQWYLVEKPKRQRKVKREKLREWRTMVRDVWRNCRIIEEIRKEKNKEDGGDPERIKELEKRLDLRYQNLELGLPGKALRSDERFYSLRSHLSDETIREIEDTKATVDNISMPDPLKSITQDIDRVESEWELL